MKMYRVSVFNDEPEEFEVLKVTEKTVTVAASKHRREHREAKATERHRWFDTLDEARMYKIERARRLVDSTRRTHERSLSALNKLLTKWEHLS